MLPLPRLFERHLVPVESRRSARIPAQAKRDGFDAFRSQALNVLTGPQARKAFDLTQGDPRTRDRYGRNAWGQRCLLARRLVESGGDLVSVALNGPLCGRVGNWDDHAVNHHVFDGMKHRAPYFDRAVEALVEDLHDRGLDKQVLLVVAGDFGRTPKISYAASTGGGVASGAEGVMQPGRDHWPQAMSFLFSGGESWKGRSSERQTAAANTPRTAVWAWATSWRRSTAISGSMPNAAA